MMKLNHFYLVGGGAILLPLLIIGAPWYPVQLGAGLLLMAFLPGYALLLALWPRPGQIPFYQAGRILLGVAVSYGITIFLFLLLAFARLPLNTFTVSGSLGGLTLIFVLLARWKKPSASAGKQLPAGLSIRGRMGWLVVVLLVALVFRVVNIHYSDHQGDEADILLRAVSLVYGHTDALLTHSKGPGEILLLNAIGALTGRFDEQTVRLPFALAGAAAIGLIMLLGVQLAGPWAGVVAGLLAALDGVFVSYARTAQYQSVVLLLTLAAIFCLYHFAGQNRASRQWHAVSAFLLAASFLVHFETILLLPVAGYLTLAPQPASGWQKNLSQTVSRLVGLWPSAIIFLVMTSAFYLPFLLHPHLNKTGVYLENRIGGGESPPFNNLAHFFYFEALKYNSAYYVALFDALLVLAGIVAWLAVARNRRPQNRPGVARILPALCLPAAILVAGGAGLMLAGWSKPAAGIMASGLALFFALVILSPYTAIPERTLWLWLAPPFWVYVFLVNRPGKHHYLFLAALMILAAGQVVRLGQWSTARWPGLKKPAARWPAAVAGLGLVLIFAAHSTMLFLRSNLEYILTFPAHQSRFYPTDAAFPYGARIGFGYPFRLGWQTIGWLKRTGQLNGSWAGNDAGNAPEWYMLGEPPTPCYPRYVLQGEITYKGDDDFNVPFNPADFGYTPRYRIWGNGRLRMTVLEFNPGAGQTGAVEIQEPFHFNHPVTAADFAATMASPLPQAPAVALNPSPVLGEGSELKNNAPAEYLERAQRLNGRVALQGYTLQTEYARPGSILPVTLFWQAQNVLSLRYKVFVHLVAADGRVWSQADDFPDCGRSHANSWPPGTVTPDRHLLKLPPDIPPGTYTLLTGMYEPDLNLRLNYFDIAGNEQGNSLTVGTVTIKEPDSH